MYAFGRNRKPFSYSKLMCSVGIFKLVGLISGVAVPDSMYHGGMAGQNMSFEMFPRFAAASGDASKATVR